MTVHDSKYLYIWVNSMIYYDLHVSSLLCAMVQHLLPALDALFSLSVSYDPSRYLES